MTFERHLRTVCTTSQWTSTPSINHSCQAMIDGSSLVVKNKRPWFHVIACSERKDKLGALEKAMEVLKTCSTFAA